MSMNTEKDRHQTIDPVASKASKTNYTQQIDIKKWTKDLFQKQQWGK